MPWRKRHFEKSQETRKEAGVVKSTVVHIYRHRYIVNVHVHVLVCVYVLNSGTFPAGLAMLDYRPYSGGFTGIVKSIATKILGEIISRAWFSTGKFNHQAGGQHSLCWLSYESSGGFKQTAGFMMHLQQKYQIIRHLWWLVAQEMIKIDRRLWWEPFFQSGNKASARINMAGTWIFFPSTWICWFSLGDKASPCRFGCRQELIRPLPRLARFSLFWLKSGKDDSFSWFIPKINGFYILVGIFPIKWQP